MARTPDQKTIATILARANYEAINGEWGVGGTVVPLVVVRSTLRAMLPPRMHQISDGYLDEQLRALLTPDEEQPIGPTMDTYIGQILEEQGISYDDLTDAYQQRLARAVLPMTSDQVVTLVENRLYEDKSAGEMRHLAVPHIKVALEHYSHEASARTERELVTLWAHNPEDRLFAEQYIATLVRLINPVGMTRRTVARVIEHQLTCTKRSLMFRGDIRSAQPVLVVLMGPANTGKSSLLKETIGMPLGRLYSDDVTLADLRDSRCAAKLTKRVLLNFDEMRKGQRGELNDAYDEGLAEDFKRVMTASLVEYRILGSHKLERAPKRATMISTANFSPATIVGSDPGMARRIISINVGRTEGRHMRFDAPEDWAFVTNQDNVLRAMRGLDEGTETEFVGSIGPSDPESWAEIRSQQETYVYIKPHIEWIREHLCTLPPDEPANKDRYTTIDVIYQSYAAWYKVRYPEGNKYLITERTLASSITAELQVNWQRIGTSRKQYWPVVPRDAQTASASYGTAESVFSRPMVPPTVARTTSPLSF